MEENKKFKLVSSKKTRYLLPNILTLGGVCLGISSIKFAMDGNFSFAVLFLVVVNPMTYKIVQALLGRFVKIAASDGCPTMAGILVHAVVFTLLLRYMMDLKV